MSDETRLSSGGVQISGAEWSSLWEVPSAAGGPSVVAIDGELESIVRAATHVVRMRSGIGPSRPSAEFVLGAEDALMLVPGVDDAWIVERIDTVAVVRWIESRLTLIVQPTTEPALIADQVDLDFAIQEADAGRLDAAVARLCTNGDQQRAATAFLQTWRHRRDAGAITCLTASGSDTSLAQAKQTINRTITWFASQETLWVVPFSAGDSRSAFVALPVSAAGFGAVVVNLLRDSGFEEWQSLEIDDLLPPRAADEVT